jgi:hypothetical protein
MKQALILVLSLLAMSGAANAQVYLGANPPNGSTYTNRDDWRSQRNDWRKESINDWRQHRDDWHDYAKENERKEHAKDPRVGEDCTEFALSRNNYLTPNGPCR